MTEQELAERLRQTNKRVLALILERYHRGATEAFEPATPPTANGKGRSWVPLTEGGLTVDLLDEIRTLELDHDPDGWPCVQTKLLTQCREEIERLRASLEAVLTTNGGPVGGDDTADGKEYVLVRSDAFRGAEYTLRGEG